MARIIPRLFSQVSRRARCPVRAADVAARLLLESLEQRDTPSTLFGRVDLRNPELSATGRHVAVIGQGSIGLLFSYVAKAAGAARVTGVDPVDRTAVAAAFGVDTVVRATSDRWVRHLSAADKPDVVIEAVGHQVATLGHAVEAAAFGGTVFYFGVPDDDSYPISMRTMLRNNLTLKSGVTLDRRRVLARADEFAKAHPELLPAYLTHTVSVSDVQSAFELACRPTPQRIKIALVA